MTQAFASIEQCIGPLVAVKKHSAPQLITRASPMSAADALTSRRVEACKGMPYPDLATLLQACTWRRKVSRKLLRAELRRCRKTLLRGCAREDGGSMGR